MALISELPEHLALSGEELVELEVGGNSYHTTVAALVQKAQADIVPVVTEQINTAIHLSPISKFAQAGAALELNIDIANQVSVFDITLDQPTCALTFIGEAAPAGFTRRLTLVLRQGTGANKIASWPANIDWAHQYTPVLSYVAGQFDIVELVLNPGDPTRWIASYVGGWVNA